MNFEAGEEGDPSTRRADLLLLGGLVITMDRARRILAPGTVVIKGDSIVAVGGPELEKVFNAGEKIDCSGQIVMPGLVNAHTHMPMTLMRGMTDDVRLDVWLHGYMMPVERRFVDPEFCRWGTLLACVEMIQGGTTCFADMYYFEDVVAAATAEAGLRAVCGETVLKFPTPDADSYDEALAKCRRFISAWKDHPLIVPAIAPHAPNTCTPDILRQATGIAMDYDVPLLIHVCETAEETRDWIEEYGHTPPKWLAELGLFRAKVLAAHCVHVSDDDLRLLADAGASVAHNPTSNLKLSSGFAPVTKMVESGLVIGIGTDGCASNNDLDMFEEMRLSSLLPKGSSGDPTAVPGRLAVEMATLGGARALFLDGMTGSLEVGKRADIIVLDVNGSHATPQYHTSADSPLSHLTYAAKASDVRHTIVNGRLLMRDRSLLTLDFVEIAHRARRFAQDISTFVINRELNPLDKLIALGEIEREETFEVQVKARIENLEAIEQMLANNPQFRIIKHTIRDQYDTYFFFADPTHGWLRYREDNICLEGGNDQGRWPSVPRILPEYRLTLIGPASEHEYENSAILTRSRYDATASRSLRFYREYFRPVSEKEIVKRRSRYRVLYEELQFSINLDQLSKPKYVFAFLEIKSRTWSSRDALRKTEMLSDLLVLFNVTPDCIVRGEYVNF